MPRLRHVVGGLAGGITGFVVGSLCYVLLDPVLENSAGFVREFQGMLWNVVPFLTLGGFALGWWAASRR